MSGFTVNNVEPCPECGAEKYGYREEIMWMFIIGCDSCDFEAPGAVVVNRAVNVDRDRKEFIEATRNFFNHWNRAVAELQGLAPKRVRITKNTLVEKREK